MVALTMQLALPLHKDGPLVWSFLLYNPLKVIKHPLKEKTSLVIIMSSHLHGPWSAAGLSASSFQSRLSCGKLFWNWDFSRQGSPAQHHKS